EGNIRIQSSSTGAITFNGAYTFPTADGTNGQILSTDGSGALSWSAAGGGGDYSDGGEAGTADRTLGNTDAFALSFLTNNIARFKIESGGDIDIAHMVKIDGEQTVYNAQAEDGFTGSLIFGNGGTNLSHAAGSEGWYNTFLGIDSGDSTTTGYYNTTAGYRSLYSNTTGYGNTASGYQTLYSNVGNSRSTAIGYNAMYYADDRTTGRNTFNTAVGYEALRGSTTAADNTGQYNTAIGPFSLYSNTTGNSSVAVGYLALSSNTTGQQNVAVGNSSLGDNTSGYHNAATGSGSLSNNTTGYYNTAFGRGALILSTTGVGNTGIGHTALENVTVGFQNTAIGYNTGRGITTGDYNTILGANVTGLTADLSNNVIIADSEGNIRIQSSSTGAITFNGAYTFPTADGTNGQILSTDGSGALSWSSAGGGGDYSDGGEAGTADRTLGNTDNYALSFLTNNVVRFKIESGGAITFNGTYTFPTADGTNGQILSTDGSGALSWSSAGGGGDYSDGGEAGTADRTLGNTDNYALSFLTNNVVRFKIESGGAITFNGTYTFPTADGTNGQILSTDGSGALSWSTAGSGGDYSDGGEAGGADRTLGNTDAFALSFLTNNLERLKIESGGDIDISQMIKIDGEQTIYNAQAEDSFTGSLIYGNGGTNLSHTSGDEGWYNTFLGIGSGSANTTGYNNTATGATSLHVNTTGYNNTATGYGSLYSNITGHSNTATGRRALYDNTTGSYNTATGRDSLYENVANGRSTAIGYAAIYYADDRTTGRNTFNTAVGYEALRGSTTAANNTGQHNTAIGDSSLHSNSSGYGNTATGVFSLFTNTTGYHNVASGYNSLAYNTTGYQNAASGYQSLYSNTTGANNTATGYQSLFDNTIGGGNIGFGYQSLYSNVANNRSMAFGTRAMYYADDRTLIPRDVYNTAVGYEALRGSTTAANNTGRYNTAIGDSALFSNTSGNQNIALGGNALYSNTTGFCNTAIGEGSLYSNATYHYNSALGYSALYSNTGGYNTAVGSHALYSNVANQRSTAIGISSMRYADDRTTGRSTYNTAVGYEALRGSATAANNTGQFNTAIGDGPLRSNTSGARNTVAGYNALDNNTTGQRNTATGVTALTTNTTGSYNTGLGQNADVSANNLTNAMALGYNALVTASNRVRIGNTTVTRIGGQVVWSNLSDARMKENVIDSDLGLDFINRLRPVTFNFIEGNEGIEYTGFIAQEVEAALQGIEFSGLNRPANENDYYSLGYATFVVPLVNAVQELNEQIFGITDQTIYNAQVEDGFTGSIIYGNGGGNLSHTIGSEGYYNTFLGIDSGHANTTGYQNTATGYGSLYDITAGLGNTAMGYNTGRGITTGDYNTVLGANVTGLASDLSNNIILADGEGTIRIQVASTGTMTLTGSLESTTNNTYDIGNTTTRWKDIYAQGEIEIGSNGDSGNIRYNTTDDQLEFSNDGTNWIPLADRSKTMTISAEYAGSVLASDGSDNKGAMTSDAEGSVANSMNYYQWNSSQTSLNDYDIRLRFTLPSDFVSWGTNAFTFHYATEANTNNNNKLDFYVYEESSSVVDGSSTDKYSSTAATWTTTTIAGADLGDCNAAGETCLVLIRMYSGNDSYSRVGDIDINYTRAL
ncbi:tail fiber domain-containing protein, partial [bacterium]|nr:tail fiber domain-containing protein [bacterium]